MKEILITSSVLIVVILLARKLFRGKVSQKLIYAAWLLVALRLLVPIQFGQSQYSVTTLTEKIENQSKPIQQVQEVLQEPVAGPSRAELYEQLLNEYLQQSTGPDLPEIHSPITPEIQEQIEEQVDDQITAPTLSEILTMVWIIGMCVMAVWFITANLLYLYKAKQGAVPFTACEAPVPVRVSHNVPTPCLVGFFRPVIYLTPASTENEQALNHVLTHELTHLRHWDHIWSILRCVCLCVYWFDPLVWIAAHQSRRDCELACDESALKKLGDGERIAYGQTLLATVTQSMSPTHLIETATAMNETKKQLKERVSFIVKKPRSILIAAICMILIAAITAGCTFVGSKITEPITTTPPATTSPSDVTNSTSVSDPPSTAPVTTNPPELIDPVYVSMLFDDPTGWYRMALTSEYSDARDLNLAKFFANGIEENCVLTDAEWDALKDFPGFERDTKRIRRLPVNEMNTVLSQCFGLSLSDMNGVGLEKMVYLESTDCYYLMSSGETVMPQFSLDDFVYNHIVYYTDGSREHRVDFRTVRQENGWYTYHIERHWIIPEDVNALTIAEELITKYNRYKYVGLFCDFELIVEDMSEHLTNAQKQEYYGQQYLIQCCHCAEEVRNHIDTALSISLNRGYPDGDLFTDDQSNLYLIILPTSHDGYRNIRIIRHSDTKIIAAADIYDEDGDFEYSEIFTLENVNGNFMITQIEKEE